MTLSTDHIELELDPSRVEFRLFTRADGTSYARLRISPAELERALDVQVKIEEKRTGQTLPYRVDDPGHVE